MNSVLISLRKLLAELRGRLDARIGRDMVVSDRLKGLIAAVAALLLFSALFGLHQLVSGLEHRYTTARTDMLRLQAQLKSNVWQTRQEQSQVLKSVLEERLWTAPTPGLADANFERWLRERMSRYKMEPLQQIPLRETAVARAAGAPAGGANTSLSEVRRITAKVVLPFDSQGLVKFLADVAEADKTVVVDRLNVRAGRNPRVELDISTFYWTRG